MLHEAVVVVCATEYKRQSETSNEVKEAKQSWWQEVMDVK